MKFIEIERTCPMCRKTSHVALTDNEWEKYMPYYLYKNQLIQEAMPDTDPAVREFVRLEEMGYCHDCMKILFGRTSERIIDGEEGFVEFFGLEDQDFASIEEFLAYEAEANTLWNKHKDDEAARIKRRDRMTEGEVIEGTEHFVIYKPL